MKRNILLTRGFTLVEIMVSVVVIVILASIVILSYDAYIDNADLSNINTSVDAYSKSLKSYANEYNAFPKNSTCLPKGSKCCTTSIDGGSTVYCLKSSEYSGYNWSTANDDKIAKYVNNNPPSFPTVDAWGECQTGFMSWGPCKAGTAVPQVGITYIANQSGSNYTSTEPSVVGKGFLVYFTDPKFKCDSTNLMKASGTNLVFDSTVSYTTQTSDYRQCIVGIRN